MCYGLQIFSSWIFNPLTTAFLQTLAWVIMTGGLHLDGLSDSIDGLGSRQNRDRTLEIMKDSHTGAFGALSLILQILLKTFFCYEINEIDPLLILLVPVTGRWGQLISIRYFPPARKDGMGHFFQEHMRFRELVLGFLTTLLVYIGTGKTAMLFILPVHALFVLLTSRRISKKLGGLTGDIYGFICETGESVVLIMIPVFFAVRLYFSLG
jgi:adenosylcobinamide-GDP ribazoletransferase